jgi:hypothetical protein
MSAKYVIIVLFLFVIAAVSDIFLNQLSYSLDANTTLKSLRPYYSKYGSILSPILAAVTVLIVFFINNILFKIMFGNFLPTTSMQTVWFFVMAIILGILADVVIDRFKVFGTSLNEYYSLPFSYMWGFLAYLFALIGSFIGYKIAIVLIR